MTKKEVTLNRFGFPDGIEEKLIEIEHIIGAYDLSNQILAAFTALIVAVRIEDERKQGLSIKLIKGLAEHIASKMRR